MADLINKRDRKMANLINNYKEGESNLDVQE